MARWAEGCLWAVALVALGSCAYFELKAWIAQTEGTRQLNQVVPVETGPSAPLGLLDSRPPLHPAVGSIVGRVEIPRLGMSTVVFEGTDDDTLDLGAGHWSASALPGDSGNVVLAGHRDTFFRGLRNIEDHDVISVSSLKGKQQYEVESTRIVNPSEIEVLAPTRQSELTLITCYPFVYLGHAPQRFVVRARALP